MGYNMDTLIKNVTVYDGLGGKPFISDISMKKGRICDIFNNIDTWEGDIIDGATLAVCPGFIDMHSHSDLEIFRENRLGCAIRQGITTEVIGQDGISLYPSVPEISEYLYRQLMYYGGTTDIRKTWRKYENFKNDVKNYDTKIESLVGHGTLRMLTCGDQKRKLSLRELDKLCAAARDCFDAGAKGISFSLIGEPSCFADEEEITAVCRVVHEYDGIAMIYLGDEKGLLLETIDYIARIGQQSGARMHISQLKVIGFDNRGKMATALEKIEKFREEGTDITFDAYPYTAMYSPISILYNGNLSDINRIFSSARLLKSAIRSTDDNIYSYGGDENIMITTSTRNKSLIGRRLNEIRDEMGISSAEIVLNLLRDEKDIQGLFFSISNYDMEILLKDPNTGICTDGIVSEFPHPRLYGTFPRVLGNYVNKLKMITM